MIPPFKKFPLAVRVVLMFFLFLFNISIVQFIAMAVAQKIFHIDNITQILGGNFTHPHAVKAFLLVQGLSSLGGFVLTAMMFSVLESGEFKNYLRLTPLPSVKLIALAVAAILVSQFFIDFLVEINKKIPLPDSLHSLRDLQKRAEELTNALLNFKDIGHFVAVSVVMALIPAVGEEFFFRGLLLGDLLKGKVHPAMAIPVTGLIFSISHTEYDNMLAIWILGSFLGYLFYVSGSLWLPIIAHFTNNFLAVLLKYLFNLGYISKNLADAKMPLYATVISLVVFGGLVFLFNKWKNPATFVEQKTTEPFNEIPSA